MSATTYIVEADLLFVPLVSLALVGYALLAPYVGRLAAVLVVLVKFLPSLLYFGILDKTYWALGDGVVYYEESLLLLQESYSWSELLFFPSGIEILVSQLDTQHVLYYWWNILTIVVLGESYQAPILGNIFVSLLAGMLFYHLLIEAGKSSSYARFGTIFFLVHWDILVWTEFTNLKGTLVMFLTMLILVCLVKISNRRKTTFIARYVIGIAIAATALWWLRLYVPVLIVVALLAWLVLNPRQLSIAYSILVLPAVYIFIKWRHLLQLIEFHSMLFGLFRFPLTPQPWSIVPVYSFLQLSSIFHWLFFVPAVFGAGRLFVHSKYGRLVVIYALVTIVFYSLLPDLWGVRHRYQTTFAWAWMQFHFLWLVKDAVDVRIGGLWTDETI